ncbi:uncharacterized protein LOC126317096 [Schistocerca gregaria]|uniref:uncharacterized protein LOC126317096 n=1 Tax=Schistocerca gregaria TaxID=7010 RepID=UPI00211DBC4C|nr:uncharacterized protein LOC126317096 [Schistocerca gregaria]XP_049849030.1 uncharacterized protein LOC126317096 [Schistocerca gregaria]
MSVIYDQEKSTSVWWGTASKTLLAGGIAGIASRTIVAPLERIKIIFQTQGSPPMYTGIVHALKKIFNEEGISGYFKGNGVNCIRIFPTSSLQFYFFETYKTIALKHFHDQQDLNPVQRLFAGGAAGISTLLIVYPFEFIRCRLALQKTKIYSGMWDCLVSTMRKEGYLSIYKGLWPSILGVVPYVGMDFAVYETLKQYSNKQSDGSLKNIIILANGAIAGTIAQTISYPLDLIRRKFQIQGFESEIVERNVYYTGVWDAVKKIYVKEGFLGFYKGLLLNFIKLVPAISVSFFVYEKMKILLKIPTRHPIIVSSKDEEKNT